MHIDAGMNVKYQASLKYGQFTGRIFVMRNKGSV